jgi:hypothetical protein
VDENDRGAAVAVAVDVERARTDRDAQDVCVYWSLWNAFRYMGFNRDRRRAESSSFVPRRSSRGRIAPPGGAA